MKRLINVSLLFGLLLAVVSSFAYLQLDLASLFSSQSLAQMGRYAGNFLHPDFSAGHLQAIWQGALETLAMADLGVESADTLKTTRFEAPAQRSRGVMVKDAVELVAKLKEKGLL